MHKARPLSTAAVLIAALITSPSCAGQSPFTAVPEPPAHHEKGGYRNLAPHDEHGFFDFLKWWFGGGPKDAPAVAADQLPAFAPPVVPPDLDSVNHPPSDAVQVTWIGHAAFLIQAGGLNILTDPMFSERASPLSFGGPRRLAPPGVALKDLPRIDAVIISHNHYDHLDEDSVKQLGNVPRYFVPLGFAPWFKERGIKNVQELDWWGSAEMGGLRFHAVPAQHFSSRTLFDRNEALWAGWVIETPLGRIYHSGCTGYAPLFQEIGKRLGPMRLSFIPIGGYSPRWFMRAMHVDPPEAVRIHQDVRSEQSVGMHWATFKLTDEHLSEPPLYLNKALKEAGIDEERFIVMKIGETRVFP
jgi:L-ascorbate metabolism protein UlaG (beta-lactamase superfamily)